MKKKQFYKLNFYQLWNEWLRIYLVHIFNLHGCILASTGKYLCVDLEYHGNVMWYDIWCALQYHWHLAFAVFSRSISSVPNIWKNSGNGEMLSLPVIFVSYIQKRITQKLKSRSLPLRKKIPNMKLLKSLSEGIHSTLYLCLKVRLHLGWLSANQKCLLFNFIQMFSYASLLPH